MKRQIIHCACIILIFCSTAGKAQLRHDFSVNYPGLRYSVGLDGNYQIASDAVTVEFQNTFLNNGFIDSEMKDASFSNMDDRAVQAAGFNTGFTFSKSRKDKPNDSWFAAARHRGHHDTEFTKDLFGLYFYGNKPYAGETADMSDMSYRTITWQQFQFGISRRLQRDSSYWQLTGAASFLNGQEYTDFTTGRGTFYTHPDAEYIEMDLYMESRQSDSSDYSFGSSNGIGASFDLMATYSHKESHYITFGVKDAGIIAWNSSSFTYTVDTLYRFEGAVSQGFFDSLFFDVSSEEDFVNSFVQEYKSGGFTTVLPIWVGAEFGKKFMGSRLTGFIAVDYLINSNYTPHFKLGGEYKFNKNIVAGTAFHTGGYARFGWELYGGFDLTGSLILTAGTHYLGGFISPGSSTAQGAVLGLKKLF